MNITDVTKNKVAIEAPQTILPRPERPAVTTARRPSQCPVRLFASILLDANPACDLSCDEIYEHFKELVDDGELPPIEKASFLRLLSAAMHALHGVDVVEDIARDGQLVRGYRGFEIGYECKPVPTGVVSTSCSD